jgi:hypothetical protein
MRMSVLRDLLDYAASAISPVLAAPVIPAQTGLRRQEAGANIRAANGPKGEQQELRVIHCGRSEKLFQFNNMASTKMDSGLRRNDGEV